MMSNTTPTVAGKQLSSGLKERLKRCGRYHASPSPVSMVTMGGRSSTSPRPITEAKAQLKLGGLETVASKQMCSVNGSSPVAKQPLRELASPKPNIKSQWDFTEMPVSKRHCVSVSGSSQSSSNKRLCLDTPSHRTSLDNTTSVSTPTSSHSILVSNKRSAHTPLTTRSSVSSKTIKGSKLDFSDKGDGISSPVDGNAEKQKRMSVDNNPESGPVDLRTPGSSDPSNTTEKELLKTIQDHEETLRKLKMVKMYRSKNNLGDLEALIEKWRAVGQQALQDLHCGLPEPRPTLTQLLEHLGIEHTLVQYNTEEESFE